MSSNRRKRILFNLLKIINQMFPAQFFTIHSRLKIEMPLHTRFGFCFPIFVCTFIFCRFKAHFIFLNFPYQLTLIIHGFFIYEFSNLLKLCVTSKSTQEAPHGHPRACVQLQKTESPISHIPSWSQTWQRLTFLFPFTVNKCPFHDLLHVIFLTIVYFVGDFTA